VVGRTTGLADFKGYMSLEVRGEIPQHRCQQVNYEQSFARLYLGEGVFLGTYVYTPITQIQLGRSLLARS